MEKFKICVDIDDTLWEFGKRWRQVINERYDRNVTDDDVAEWDITMAYPDIPPKKLFEVANDPEFFKTIPPIPDAVKYMRKLVDDGHDIYLASSSNPDLWGDKLRAIENLYPFIDVSANAILIHKKQLLRCDILIDDAIHNLVGGKYLGLMLDRPTNRKVHIPPNQNIIRLYDWKGIYNVIRERRT